MWQNSGLEWSLFVPATEVKTFLRDRKLDWLDKVSICMPLHFVSLFNTHQLSQFCHLHTCQQIFSKVVIKILLRLKYFTMLHSKKTGTVVLLSSD